MSVAVWSGSGLAWDRELTALKCRLAPVFRSSDVVASAGAFMDGLLLGRTNSVSTLSLTRPAPLPLPEIAAVRDAG